MSCLITIKAAIAPCARALDRNLPRLALLCLVFACSSPAEAPSNRGEASIRPGANQAFLSEDLDVERFVEIFEGESREISAQRERYACASSEPFPGVAVIVTISRTAIMSPLRANVRRDFL